MVDVPTFNRYDPRLHEPPPKKVMPVRTYRECYYCIRHIPTGHLLCRKHYNMLPEDLRPGRGSLTKEKLGRIKNYLRSHDTSYGTKPI
jgi:hypothetical protein